METFLIAFLAVAIAEMGDRPQLLGAALAARYERDGPVMAGLALASLLNCLISAYAGSFIKDWISEDPLLLFRSLAYIFAGAALLAPRKAIDVLSGWKTGPFWTSFLGLFILQFGDKSQFLIAVEGAAGKHWWLAALGGWLGMMVACGAAILLKQKLAAMIPMRAFRLVSGAIMLAVGMVMALNAWRIL